MAQFKFSGSIYENTEKYHAAIAKKWLNAWGGDSLSRQREILEYNTASQIAQECDEQWFISEIDDFVFDDLVKAIKALQEISRKNTTDYD